MNLSLRLDGDLARRLNVMAQTMGQSRNALVRKAVEEWLARQTGPRWPAEVARCSGLPEAVPFEDTRSELLHPEEHFDGVPP